MVGNVKETRGELRQKRWDTRDTGQRDSRDNGWTQRGAGHRKQESKDSTSSADTQHSDTSHTDRVMGSLVNILALERERGEGI